MLTERLLRRYAGHYILIMMCVTRLFAGVGAVLCFIYVNITFRLPVHTQEHIAIAALSFASFAIIFTVLMAQWETRSLRRVLLACHEREAIDLPLAIEAGREVVLFPARHALREAIIDPFITIVPWCALLYYDGVS